MCWRDDVVRRRRCNQCGLYYYGDLGHRNCPGPGRKVRIEDSIEPDKNLPDPGAEPA